MKGPAKLAVCAIAVVLTATGCANGTPDERNPGSTPGRTSEKPKQWTMPNLVGAGLQQAQDNLQALTGNAIFFTTSHDVGGQGRNQVLDADWKVCSQNVAAGAPIGIDTKIDFGVVKVRESCP